ncbi:hypothetical protein RKD23_006857 [Streptomyces sp. SAI-170]
MTVKSATVVPSSPRSAAGPSAPSHTASGPATATWQRSASLRVQGTTRP